MMPSSVKNDRSLWLHTVCRACRMASVNCMAGKLTVKEPGKGEGGRVVVGPFPFPASPASYRLFISQRLDRIEPRGLARGVEPEQDARQGRHDQRDDHRRERHMLRTAKLLSWPGRRWRRSRIASVTSSIASAVVAAGAGPTSRSIQPFQ